MMILRPYQLDLIARARQAYAQGARRLLLVAPCGAGKTSIGAAVATGALSRGRRVLWLAHRRELVAQARERLEATGLRVGTLMAGEACDLGAPVQVASVDTLTARGIRPDADVVVWDECHHCAAESFRVLASKYPSAAHLGLTATPERADGIGLADAFDVLVPGPSVRELVAGGFLVPADVIAPPDSDAYLASSEARAVVTHGGPAIVFASTVARSKAVALEIPRAAHVDGCTDAASRAGSVARFRSGELDVLSNVFVFTEGFDAPRARVCVVARRVGSASTWLQMVGRVMRTHEGKARALVVDLTGAVHKHGLPDADREYSLEGRGVRLAARAQPVRQCPKCFAAFEPCPQCPSCAYVVPPPEALRVRERAMARVLQPNAPPDQRASRLAAWRTEAQAKGYRPGWAAWKYRATFGEWPPHRGERLGALSRRIAATGGWSADVANEAAERITEIISEGD